LARANYGVIIATPEDVCLDQVSTIRNEMQREFPDVSVQRLHVVLNRVRGPNDVLRWMFLHPKGLITNVDKLTDDYYGNSVFFDLGYDTFSADVRESLGRIFTMEDQKLVPSEYDTWLRPWVSLLYRDGLLEKIKNQRELRVQSWLSLLAPI